MIRIDMSDDYRIWDNPESIRLESARRNPLPNVSRDLLKRDGFVADPYRAPDANEAGIIKVAKRRALTRRELAASLGAYTGRDMVWLIPAKELIPNHEIKVGDVVESLSDVFETAGERWTALEVSHNKWRQTWRLTCRNLVLAFDLRDLVDLQRAKVGFDEAGAAVKTFPPHGGGTTYKNVPARVQPRQTDVVDERGIRYSQTVYDVIVGRAVDVNTVEDRILWGNLTLDIISVRDAETITDLMTLEAVLKS